MSKTRDTGYLANVIQVHDTGVRIMSGSEMLMEISSSGAVTITGELSGSDAANALLLSGTGSVGFTTTGSFTTMSSSLSSRTTQIESVYATTGSNSFRATQSITGSLTVTGQIIAQTLNVQQVTSSIIFSTGSNTFGCDLNNRQTFTGSFFQTGSVAVFNSCVGIGLNNPTNRLEVQSGDIKLNAGASRCTSIFFGITGTNYGRIQYSDMDGSMLITTIGSGAGYDLNLGTKCVTRLTISGDGNVGINVSCPANLLHLAGASATPSLRLGSISNGFHWDIGRENATTGDFIFNNANGGATTEKARITVGGNFGIGIACPATRLTVHVGSGAISGTNDAIRLQVPSYLNASRNTILWHQDSGDTILGRFGLEWSTSTSQMNFIWRDIYNNITGSTELMRLTGGGNLLVGAASNASGAPTFYVQNKVGAVANIAGWNFGGTTTSENGNNNLLNSGAYYNGSSMVATQTTATGYQQYSGIHVWYTNSGLTPGSTYSNTERMRINAAGGVRIGNPTAFNEDIRFNVYGTGVWDGANIGLQNGGTGGKDWIIFSTMCAFGQGAGNLLFYNNSGPTANALIIYANGNYDFGGSDVSDVRLKQCIQNLNYGVNEIMQLSPKSYNLKSEDNLQQENQTVLRKRYGFIAQEVQPILPDTITGQETETDYLGLDYNGVLAVAVKAIQEQQCKIALLESCLGIA
jgi:hypothetical protein